MPEERDRDRRASMKTRNRRTWMSDLPARRQAGTRGESNDSKSQTE